MSVVGKLSATGSMKRQTADDEGTRRYGSASGDMAWDRWLSPLLSVNGHNDPLALRAMVRFRDMCRAGDELSLPMHAKRPGVGAHELGYACGHGANNG